jgi:anti-sigma regulatory factor (Ser/Thr protein kinase)
MQMLDSSRQTRLQVEDASHIGEYRRAAQALAETFDFDETEVGRVGIVASELINNVVKHAGRGEMLLQAITMGEQVSIELVSIDRGPGMQVDKCMRDGYSTSGTSGTGLGAISRLSSVFDVYSTEGQGTVAVSRIARQTGAARASRSSTALGLQPEFGAVCLAVAGETECGDSWRIARTDDAIILMVVDGLGHGPLAASAARTATDIFEKRALDPPAEIMQFMHHALSGSRGAAAACAVLDVAKASITYSGIGNIAASVVCDERSKGMVSHNGILGVQLVRRREFSYDCKPECRVVMHSDGLSARWALQSYPGLWSRHAAVIAAVLYRDHARSRDDATILVTGRQS